MLRITKLDGTNFSPTNVESINNGSHLVNLKFVITSNTSVNCTIYWDDKNETVSFTRKASPFTVNVSKLFRPGTYTVKIVCSDNVYPNNETKTFYFSVKVVQSKVDVIPKVRFAIGPILPKDSGNPSPDQWIFNSGSDLEILSSSVKSILGTSVGERIMEPEFGTEIRKYIFDPILSNLQSLILDNIVDSLSRWEPRVSVTNIDVAREDSRSMSIKLSLVSNINGYSFDTMVNVVN